MKDYGEKGSVGQVFFEPSLSMKDPTNWKNQLINHKKLDFDAMEWVGMLSKYNSPWNEWVIMARKNDQAFFAPIFCGKSSRRTYRHHYIAAKHFRFRTDVTIGTVSTKHEIADIIVSEGLWRPVSLLTKRCAMGRVHDLRHGSPVDKVHRGVMLDAQIQVGKIVAQMVRERMPFNGQVYEGVIYLITNYIGENSARAFANLVLDRDDAPLHLYYFAEKANPQRVVDEILHHADIKDDRVKPEV